MANRLALVSIVKNETRYILEWIAHYRSIGIRDIIIYDNQTDDDPDEILRKLAERGIITYVLWPTQESLSPQMTAYSDAVARLSSTYDFVAFFDADEFLVPRTELGFPEWLDQVPDDVGAIAVNQRVFGSSGQLHSEEGLVIERFTMAAEENYRENLWVKSVYRLSALSRILNPHRGLVAQGRYILPNGEDAFEPGEMQGQAKSIDFSLFQLNHYIVKSLEEFLSKRERGGAAAARREDRLARYANMDFFHGRDAYINKAKDLRLAERAPALRQELDHLRTILAQ